MFGSQPPVLQAKLAENAITASFPGPKNFDGNETKYACGHHFSVTSISFKSTVYNPSKHQSAKIPSSLVRYLLSEARHVCDEFKRPKQRLRLEHVSVVRADRGGQDGGRRDGKEKVLQGWVPRGGDGAHTALSNPSVLAQTRVKTNFKTSEKRMETHHPGDDRLGFRHICSPAGRRF